MQYLWGCGSRGCISLGISTYLYHELPVGGIHYLAQHLLHQQREVQLVHGHVRQRGLLQGKTERSSARTWSCQTASVAARKDSKVIRTRDMYLYSIAYKIWLPKKYHIEKPKYHIISFKPSAAKATFVQCTKTRKSLKTT